MTPELRRQVCEYYIRHLTGLGYVEQKTEHYSVYVAVGVGHAIWMCRRTIEFIDAGRIEKADRWLGHIQGILWMSCIFTHEEERAHNAGHLPE